MPMVELSNRMSDALVDPRVITWMNQVTSPMLGPVSQVTAVRYDMSSPGVYTFIPTISHIERRLGTSMIAQYHVGGYGLTPTDALTKAIGEAIERMGHVSSIPVIRHHIGSSDGPYVAPQQFQQFSDDQWASAGFPYQQVDVGQISWVDALDTRTFDLVYVPRQLALVGSRPEDEPPINLAVTTGTAAHTSYKVAFFKAVLELIEIDTVMGYWYGNTQPHRVTVNFETTPRLSQMLRRYRSSLNRQDTHFEFYWLPQIDNLPIFVALCAIVTDDVPWLSCGVGSAWDLESAMLSALLESIPVAGLAFSTFIRKIALKSPLPTDGNQIKDLDENVLWYALSPDALSTFRKKFGEQITKVDSRDIDTPYVAVMPDSTISNILSTFKIYAIDLTTVESKSLGFWVQRLLSADLLRLCSPSYPERAHPRFVRYGGSMNEAPHPFA